MNMRTKEEIIKDGGISEMTSCDDVRNEILIDIRDCLVELIRVAKRG